jgi:hypothetical protein
MSILSDCVQCAHLQCRSTFRVSQPLFDERGEVKTNIMSTRSSRSLNANEELSNSVIIAQVFECVKDHDVTHYKTIQDCPDRYLI